MFRVFTIIVYKTDTPFKRTLAYNQHRYILVASSDEKCYVFFYSESVVFDKVSNKNYRAIIIALRRIRYVTTHLNIN